MGGKRGPDMEKQLQEMLDMQDRMNRRVHSDWIAQNFEWYRALWLECGELIDHFGYKWWKRQTPDMPQVRLEVVDIWHFGMSMLFDGRSSEQIAHGLFEEIEGVETIEGLDSAESDVLAAAEALALHTLSEKAFSMRRFWNLVLATGMSFDDLYRDYVAKNVLNFFRQDHGYQEGDYVKNWEGREDNQHLVDIVATLDPGALGFADHLYQALDDRYRELVLPGPQQ